MSQPLFKDPIVSSAPALTGTGNGTLTVDRLTHFTVAQDYTATCIQKTPDTLLSIVGSLDGTIGIATVGTQFFDEDLKVFLTIQQGSTVFEVGDQFEFSVENGTDLNQANIDDYDELPQKNFGEGTLGVLKGDHNLRYSNTALAAYRYIQDLKYTAVTAGSAGNAITIEYTTGGTAGAEGVSVISSAITVQIEDLVSTATQIKAAIDATPAAAALVSVSISGASGAFQFGPVSPLNLEGGKNKNFALNHDEFTDSGAFVEGNANIRARDATLRGALDVTGNSIFRRPAALADADSSNQSGPTIANPQQFLNQLLSTQKIQLSSQSGAFIAWTTPNLSCADDIDVNFTDTGYSNVIDMASPISIADGESAYVVLDPYNNGTTLTPQVSASLPTSVLAFRLATRVGSLLILFNGSVLNTTESARLGNSGSATSNVTNAIVRRDSSGDFAARNVTTNKTIVASGSGNGLDVASAGNLEIGVSAGANNLTIGGGSTNVVIPGNLEVQGTTTTINTATLDVEDQNITINNGGTDGSSEGAGLTVDRTGTSGSLIYAAAAASRWKAGDLGSEVEVITKTHTQALTNKDYDGGTASDTSRITVPKDTKTNLDALTRKEGTIVYASDENKMYADDGATLQLIGATIYRSATASIGSGVATLVVTFSSALPSANYSVNATMSNVIDASPQFQPITITAKSTTGFTATWNANTDSANYKIEYVAIPHS